MRSLILIFFALGLGSTALAETQEFDCPACRDVRSYPQDFGNFAFNVKVAGAADGQLVYSAQVMVWNPRGQWGRVNLSRDMDSSGLSIYVPPLFGYQVPYPSPYMTISVQDQYGTLTTYQVLVDSPPLDVGDGSVDPSDSTAEPEPETVDEPDKQGTGGELTWSGDYSYDTTSTYDVYYVYELSDQ